MYKPFCNLEIVVNSSMSVLHCASPTESFYDNYYFLSINKVISIKIDFSKILLFNIAREFEFLLE